MPKYVYWIGGILFFGAIVNAVQQGPNAGNSPTSTAAPQKLKSPMDDMRQRVAADKQASEDLKRLEKLDFNAFCAKELPKLRTKISSAQAEAIQFASLAHSVLPSDWESVKKKTVGVGTSSCAAIAAWGRPEKINTTSHSNFTREQWVYSSGNYLYIEDEKVRSMQTSR